MPYSWEYCSAYGIPGYDAWKTRSPDDDCGEPFACLACDDMGCPECCEPTLITLDDLDEIAEQIDLAQTHSSAQDREP